MPDSQYNLGILYARGIGVEVNLAEAYKWFTLAARDGDKDATAKRDDVGGRIDQKALMAARAAAQVWTAMPQPEAAVQVKAPAGGWDTPAPAAPVTRRGGPKVEAAPQLHWSPAKSLQEKDQKKSTERAWRDEHR
jgi:localization factor PodJL